MSKENLRYDKTCLNCNHVVEKHFCPNCGQENTESRKTFHYLFTHFLEDLVHYDGAFWKTIKTLLFRPGQLTVAYLSGKRKTFVPPVKLYIFINFLAFFLLSVLPSGHQQEESPNKEVRQDSTKNVIINDVSFGKYSSVKEMDSIQKTLPKSERLDGIDAFVERKFSAINEKYTPQEFRDKLLESIQHILPKVLFLYMPLFALTLWLFHGKKKWYYFDHGIFTLHYFSFLLLTFSGILVLTSVFSYLDQLIELSIVSISNAIMIGWWFFYFFRSHRRFYGESRLISRVKGVGLFIINMTFIVIFMVGTLFYSIINIH